MAPAPMSAPPTALRVRFSEQLVPVHEPFEPRTANPTATATTPVIAATMGMARLGGRGGGAGGGTGTAGAGSSSWGFSMSASRIMLSRASTTVQTSQVLDFGAMGSAAGGEPSVGNTRATGL